MKMSKKKVNLRNGLINELLEKCLYYSTRNEVNQNALIEEFIELNLVASSIREIEKCLFVEHLREDNLKAFTSWLSSNGCSLDGIEITCVDRETREYGLITKKSITENDLLLKIPRKLMMTTETALSDSSLKSATLEDSLLKSMPNVLLAFHLMIEYCSKESFWKPYILSCPSSYLTPLYYTQEDLLLLKGSPGLVESVKLVRNIYRQYAYFWKRMSTKTSSLSKLTSLKGLYSIDLYRWAISTVMTRQNQIPVSPESLDPADSSSKPDLHLSALIPLWDFCNHAKGKFSTDYDPLESALLCYAMKDFNPSEEITIFYGKRTNMEFLVNNGFVPSENLYDFTTIRLGLSQVDPLYDLRSKLCSLIGLPVSGYFALHPSTLGLDEDLLNFIKIFLMDKFMLDKLCDSGRAIELFKDLPEALTVKAVNFISIRCQLLLKGYPSLEPVKQTHLSPCGQQIIKLIDCEKQILSSNVQKPANNGLVK